MTKNIIIGVLVAVVIAIGAFLFFKETPQIIAGSTGCGSITCLSGGLRLVSDAGGDFESDVAALFASTVGITGTATISGSAAFSGSTSFATTTTSGGVTLTKAVGCITFNATSTATPGHLVFATGSTTATTIGFLGYAYGACTN